LKKSKGFRFFSYAENYLQPAGLSLFARGLKICAIPNSKKVKNSKTNEKMNIKFTPKSSYWFCTLLLSNFTFAQLSGTISVPSVRTPAYLL